MARRRTKGEGSIYKRTRKRKDGSVYVIWVAEVTVGYDAEGQQIRKRIYGKTQREVLDKSTELKSQIATGTYADTRLTVSQYLKEWLDYKKLELKPRTQHFYADYIRLYIEPHVGRVLLAKLTPLHIQSMMADVAKRVSSDAANKSRGLLNSALKRAVRLGLIMRNPVDAVDKLRHEPKDVTLWTPEQVRCFLEVAKSNRLYAAFYLAIMTGMRHGEILGVRWQDIDKDVITVRQSVVNVKSAQYQISTPKTKKGIRRIVIDADTLQVLAEHKERQERERDYLGRNWVDSGLMFTNEFGDVLVPRNFDREWYGLLTQSELPRIRFHDLRHLHVSLLIKQGFDPRTVADRVGHTDPAFMLKRYSHMFEAQRRAAALTLNQLLGMEETPDPEPPADDEEEGEE